MSMQIGAMLRALMGDAAPADSRTLELRIGQIVRGVLMQMLDNGEAMININGTPVRAKLEADLPVGRGTLLQVQPGSNGGMIVLKPLADMSEFVPDETMKNVLKSFGLPDQRWSYELIRGLKRDGYPIGNDAASFFRAAAAMKPASVDAGSWMAAADVAFRRGLPATEATLGALRQTLVGPPLHESLAAFTASFKLLANGEGSDTVKSAAWASRMLALLSDGEQLLAQGGAQLAARTGAPGAQAAGPQTAAAGSADIVPNPANARPAGGVIASAPADVPAGGMNRTVANAVQAAQTLPTATNAPAVTGQSILAGSGPAAAAMAPQVGATRQEGAVASQTAEAGNPVAGSTAHDATATANTASGRTETNWIGRFMQWLGVNHESRLMQQTADVRPQGELQLPGDRALPATESKAVVAETIRQAAFESLKSALLSLMAHEDAPPALREAAQTLASQITGQQLLLSSERQANQPYSLMTLFVPMKGENGDTTATVHVQTRRSRKGEWDADNCRLLFDLRMHHLGDTLVDVQVVDRIVSVKLMNDHPLMAAIIEQARGELGEGLREAGFQLLSLSAQPLPQIQASVPAESDESADRPHLPLPSAYAAKPYKGVDFRI